MNLKGVAALLILLTVGVSNIGLVAGARDRQVVDADLILRGGDHMAVEDTDLVVRGVVQMSGDSSLTLTRSSLTLIPPASSGGGGYIRMIDDSILVAVDSTMFSNVSMAVVASGECNVRLSGVTIADSGVATGTRYSLEVWTFDDALKDFRILSGVSVSQDAALAAEGLTAGIVATSSTAYTQIKDSRVKILTPSRAGPTTVNGSRIGLLMLQSLGGTISGVHEGFHRAWNSTQIGGSNVSQVSLVDSSIDHLWVTAVGDVVLSDAELTVAVLNGGTYEVAGSKIGFLAMLNGVSESAVTDSVIGSFGVYSFDTPPDSGVRLRGSQVGRAKFNSFAGGMRVEASGCDFGQLYVNYGAQPGSSYGFSDCLIGYTTVVSSPSLSMGFNNTRVSGDLRLLSGEAPGDALIRGELGFSNTRLFEDELGSVTITREYSVLASRSGVPLVGVKVDLRKADMTIRAEETDPDGWAYFTVSWEGGPGSSGNLTSALRLFTTYGDQTIITPVGLLSDTPILVEYGVFGARDSQVIAAAAFAILIIFVAYVVRCSRLV